MKRFSHQNIVALHGVCTREEPAYFIMEFLLHGNLLTQIYLPILNFVLGLKTYS